MARAVELLADEARKHGDVERRAVVKVLLVGRYEGRRVAAVDALAKHDAGIRAAAEVESGTLGEGSGGTALFEAETLFQVVCGVAGCVLLVALAHGGGDLA